MALNLPGFYEDPYYEKAQAPLFETGAGVLRGEIPEFYRDIATPGGGAFTAMLAQIKKGVGRGVYEHMARVPGRKGLAADVIGRTMGDIESKLRWEDVLRATKGKQFLFGAGADILAGVRGAGLTAGAGRRGWELSKAGLQLQEEELGLKREQIAARERAAKSKMWGDILSAGLGAAGTVGGFMLGGPLGAAAGGKLAGTLTGDISEIMPAGGLGLRGEDEWWRR